MANKKSLISEFEQFNETVEKGLQVLEQYESIMERVEMVKEASAKATKKLNKLAEKGTLQSKATNGELTITQTLMGVYNGQITVATAATGLWAKAQNALNLAMSAHPLGVITVALGALVAGIEIYRRFTDDASNSTYKLTSEQEKLIQKSKEMQQTYADMDNARREAMIGVQAEYGHYEELGEELIGLIDTNGKVKSGYEDRANFIVNQLSTAFGMEKEQIWEMISSNGDLEASLDKVMRKKKAEAMLMANEQAYADAIREKDVAFSTYCESLKSLDEAEKKYNATKKVAVEYEKILKSGNEERAEEYRRTHMDEILGVEEAKKAYEKQKKSVEDNEAAYIGYLATIQDYEGLSSAILSDDAEKMELAMQNITNSFITAEVGTTTTLKKQKENMKSYYEDLKKAIKDGSPIVTEEMEAQAQVMAERAEAELMKSYESALPGITKALQNVGITASETLLDTITSKEEDLQIKTLELLNQISTGAALQEEELVTLISGLGIKTSDSLINALAEKEVTVQEEAIQLLSQLSLGVELKEEELTLLFSNLGIVSSDSLINSLVEKEVSVQEEAIDLLLQMEKAEGLKKDGIIARLEGLGVNVDDGLIDGMNSKKDEVKNTAGGLGTTIYSAIKKVLGINSPSKETAKLGRSTGKGFVKGIKEQIPQVRKASEDLAASALQHMDVQGYLVKMRSAMSMEKATIGANMTSRVVHEFVMGNQSDFMNVGDKIENLQKHIDGIKIQLLLEGKTYIDKREAGYILAPEINKRLGEFAELKGRGNNSK